VSVRAARALAHLVRERLGHGLRDERLAAARRPVEEHALRRLELMLLEQLRVQERQLDRVPDRLDLALEAADVLVGHVGDLLEDELLDLLLGQLLEGDVRARIHQQWVAGSDLLRPEDLGRVATNSSSPRPTTTTRSSPSRSFTFRTSPARSGSRTSTTFNASLRITSEPLTRVASFRSGETFTRILRPR